MGALVRWYRGTQPMTDNHSMPWDGVTEGDRSAAIEALNAAERQRSFGGNGTVLSQVRDIFARHRQLSAAAERARIVAWLRKEADALAIEQANTRQGSPDWLCLREQVEDHQLIADAIERGEV